LQRNGQNATPCACLHNLLHWNGITWRKQHKGMRRSLYCLWSKPCWRFWAFLIRARGTSLDMHFHKLRRMRNLWHCISMQVTLCEEHKSGMDCHIIRAKICQVHLTWRNASNLWFPCIKHLLQMVCIFKPFQYFNFNFSIKVWTYFLQILFILI
jgi:hypothetical protein